MIEEIYTLWQPAWKKEQELLNKSLLASLSWLYCRQIFLMSEPPEKPSIHDMFIKLRNAIPWGGSKCLYDTSSYWTPKSLFPPRLLGILEKVFNWERRPRVQALGMKVHSSRSPLACSAFTIALYNEGQCTRRLFWLSNIPWIYVTSISLWMFFWHTQRGICLVQAPFRQVCCLLSLPIPIGPT